MKTPALNPEPWGKTDAAGSFHPLGCHCADVAACFGRLCREPVFARRLARAANRTILDDRLISRLEVLAFLHDFGKLNAGFQAKGFPREAFEGHHPPPPAGHLAEAWNGLLSVPWLREAIGYRVLVEWCGGDEEIAQSYLLAVWSHHGRPLNVRRAMAAGEGVLWRPARGYDPRVAAEALGDQARTWFPAAHAEGAPCLPPEAGFQHLFAGLCCLADWIGSDREFFPFESGAPTADYLCRARCRADAALRAIGLIPGPVGDAIGDFEAVFGNPPYPAQAAAAETPIEERLLILESETGSGKTEAALWRFCHLRAAGEVDGLYFAVPTRAAAVQLWRRVRRMVEAAFPPANRPQTVLAVPGYLLAGAGEGRRLPGFEVLWDDAPDAATRARRWAAESAKRYLAAEIAVGTVDQAMLAALQVSHAHLRAASLSRGLLVIDEVHASDAYMRVILDGLLKAHLEAGGHAMLMSATLGAAARDVWLGRAAERDPGAVARAIAVPYPALSRGRGAGARTVGLPANGRLKTIAMATLPQIGAPDAIAPIVLDAARRGAKVLIVRNTVADAIATARALEAREPERLFRVHGVGTLHHGRFAAVDRRQLDAAVETTLGHRRAPGGIVVVGTQTLEQSLDIDADFLLTDLCPVDVLLQRLGRLHRRHRDDRPAAFAEPHCVVLVPESLADHLPPRRAAHGLGGRVYADLRILEATRRLIAERPVWEIPVMNRELVERATHPVALDALARELGPAWVAHGGAVEGERIGNRLSARQLLVRRDLPFASDDVAFADAEEAIRTRLGDEGPRVAFDPPPAGPFGEAIAELAIPAHLARGLDPVAVPAGVASVPDGFAFSLDTARFTYDRFGLRKDDPDA